MDNIGMDERKDRKRGVIIEDKKFVGGAVTPEELRRFVLLGKMP